MLEELDSEEELLDSSEVAVSELLLEESVEVVVPLLDDESLLYFDMSTA